ncbi:unnamed protein product [Musa textilis]
MEKDVLSWQSIIAATHSSDLQRRASFHALSRANTTRSNVEISR